MSQRTVPLLGLRQTRSTGGRRPCHDTTKDEQASKQAAVVASQLAPTTITAILLHHVLMLPDEALSATATLLQHGEAPSEARVGPELASTMLD